VKINRCSNLEERFPQAYFSLSVNASVQVTPAPALTENCQKWAEDLHMHLNKRVSR
jgi:hypothetical protein